MMTLRKKLFEIQKSVSLMKKDAKSHQHSFLSGKQILVAVRKKMDQLGVMLETHIEDHINTEFETHMIPVYDRKLQKEILKPQVFSRVSVRAKMVWIDVDSDDQIIIPWPIIGEHDNDISQAFGSAMTYSERYFLTKYFKIPSDDDDPDSKGMTQKRMEKRTSPAYQATLMFASNDGKYQKGTPLDDISDIKLLESHVKWASGKNEFYHSALKKRLEELQK